MDWCILRCSSQRTLPLTDGLAKLGYEAWSPRQTIKRRLPGGTYKISDTLQINEGGLFVHLKRVTLECHDIPGGASAIRVGLPSPAHKPLVFDTNLRLVTDYA